MVRPRFLLPLANYTVIGTINDANYQGSATDTLVIGKASSTISLGSLNQTYDGSAKAATATTTPGGLAGASLTTVRPQFHQRRQLHSDWHNQ